MTVAVSLSHANGYFRPYQLRHNFMDVKRKMLNVNNIRFRIQIQIKYGVRKSFYIIKTIVWNQGKRTYWLLRLISVEISDCYSCLSCFKKVISSFASCNSSKWKTHDWNQIRNNSETTENCREKFLRLREYLSWPKHCLRFAVDWTRKELLLWRATQKEAFQTEKS